MLGYNKYLVTRKSEERKNYKHHTIVSHSGTALIVDRMRQAPGENEESSAA